MERKETIYDIVGKFYELFALASSFDEEELEKFEESLRETELLLMEDFENKIDSYVHVIKNLEFQKEQVIAGKKYLDNEKAKMLNKERSLENNIKRMKETLLWAMNQLEIPKVKTPEFTVSKRKTTSLEINDLEKAYELGLAQIEYKPDKKSIKKYVEENDDSNIATIITGESLVIK